MWYRLPGMGAPVEDRACATAVCGNVGSASVRASEAAGALTAWLCVCGGAVCDTAAVTGFGCVTSRLGVCVVSYV